MHEYATILITLGALFMLGMATDVLGRHTPLPRVTLLLVLGFLIGPSALGLLPEVGAEIVDLVSVMALVMIGFLIGGTLTRKSLRAHGRRVLIVSAAMVLATVAIVALGLLALGTPLAVALLLAGIAPATDPAATADVAREAGAKGPFTETLMGIVAVDDAWGLLAFTLMLAVVSTVEAGAVGGASVGAIVTHSAWEIGGALALGLGLGLPMAYLSGRIRKGEPLQAEALGMVFLCGGLALALEVSFVLAAMAMGATVSNLARHHRRPFHAIEGIEWPFLVLFFVLAGASMELATLHQAGLALTGYLVLRVAGRLAGAWAGGALAGDAPAERWWLGLAMLPQAGVALGMALIAVQRVPEIGAVIMPVVVAATVLFEIVGPVITRQALRRTGEA